MLEQASLSDSVEIQAAPWVLSIRPVAALREVYRAKLTGSLKKNEYDNLFSGSACFVGVAEGYYDALIVDESHRLMTKTIYNKEGENQIKEIIHASKLIVFFLDEDQRVTSTTTASRKPAATAHIRDREVEPEPRGRAAPRSTAIAVPRRLDEFHA